MNIVKQYINGQRSRITIDIRNKEIRLKLSQTDLYAYDELFEFALLLANYCEKHIKKEFTIRGKLDVYNVLLVLKIYTRQNKYLYSIIKTRVNNRIVKKRNFRKMREWIQ